MRISLTCCAVLAVFAALAPVASAGPKRDNTPPTTPTNVRVVSVTEDSITIAWDASTDNSGRLHAYIAGGIYHSPTSTTKTFTHLVPNTTRTYFVQAIDPSGNMSGLSEPVTATTASDTTAPTTPANLRVTATGISTVSLAWDRSSDRWSFVYDVLMDGALVTTVPHPYMGTPTAFLRKIRPGTHTFVVRARDTAGNRSGDSNTVTVVLEGNGDTTPPSAPTNLEVEDFDDNCGSLLLSWTPSTDDLDDPSQLEYELHRNGGLAHVTPPGASWLGIYTVAGPQTWTAVAVDRAGNMSAPSNAVSLTVTVNPDLC